ncbi:TBPIP-domain-containing protein [Leucogyrophana mollusca]|uniref:TBPIP-domain-containing protein n=1 Tax=Leucogyrophana mollusca TaxID=85980 RepID=A0ACB8BKL6_9AGAM|nr:TBPIP-domain-containing protein [Leucogyrophana mollusca]
MATKAKSADTVRVLKGQEAEDAVLQYIKRMNRPFGAVDVAANLKGTVPKTATQKILVALAEKGELVQKTYGKTSFFVVNQANIKSIPPDELAALEAESKLIEESNAVGAVEIKAALLELAKLKNTPTDDDLDTQIASTEDAIASHTTRLAPLRAGAPKISPHELAQLDADWARWRAEWVRRRRVFENFWALATDALPPQDAAALAEDLGIEIDTAEHGVLERADADKNLKRKRA